MITRSRFSALALLPLLGILAACDDDPITPSDTLTQAEVEALVDALVEAAVDIDLVTPAALVGGPAPVEETFTVNDTLACALGGTLRVVGTVTIDYDDATETGTYEHELVQTHVGCRVRPANLATDFILDGGPSVVSTVEAHFDGETMDDFEGAETGSIRWRFANRSGTCAVALTYAMAAGTPAEPSYQVTGTLCQRTVNRVVALAN